ncbi:DUF3422 family protein [Coralliovum pocilloporae]|uniref:DUF3422 family protein n=1 Tax=Coralliovum pocilloporae TaxID=3066369 RepID=UPI0033073997
MVALSFEDHEERAALLGEVHARPFRLVAGKRVFLHMAFMVNQDELARDRAFIDKLSAQNGQPGPGSRRYHELQVQGGMLRWEAHSEFVSYSWDAPTPFIQIADMAHPFGNGFQAPGRLVSATRIDLSDDTGACQKAIDGLDPASLCISSVHGGKAQIATDFRQDGDGFTHIVVVDGGLETSRAGALVQRLLEIDTYRVFALFGLPEAQRAGPEVAGIEQALVRITEDMKTTGGLEDNNRLLTELTILAARLEAVAVAGLYRFGASRAYHEIVQMRLGAIEETVLPDHETWGAFLNRRLMPAMRTCHSIEEREANLSRKLERAATLLRTRVDVEMQSQNRDLLESMNRRASLQLRLQQTVEGLSVAAVSYYIVGLVAYLIKGSKGLDLPVSPAVATALSVPPVILAVWWMVRRIRKHHDDGIES